MREILFRGKAINRNPDREYRTEYRNGDWVYGLITKLYDERFENLPAEMTNTDGISRIDVDYKTLGQYTNLTDRNGTKIFEGDILEFIDSDNEISYYTVKWLNYRWLIVDSQGHTDNFDEFVKENMSVVGNIYDNPELLEAEE